MEDKDNNFKQSIRLFNQYMKRKGWSNRTIETYNHNLKQFFQFIRTTTNKKKIKEITDITSKEINNFQSCLFYYKNNKNKGYSIQSQINKLGTLRAFFKYLQENNYIIINPASDIILPKAEKKISKRAIKEKEVEKIFKVIDSQTLIGYRDRVIIELLYTTGIRVSELINLKMSHINFDDDLLLIEKGKGNKDRYVPLCNRMKKYLKEYLTKVRLELLKKNLKKKDDQYLFLNQYGERIHRRSTINYTIKKYCKKAKIKGQIGAHNFRVSCGSAMLKGGANERYVQELLGHRKLETTERYLRIQISGLKEEHTRKHPREAHLPHPCGR